MNSLITRDGYIEEVWRVEYIRNGFKYYIYVQGTEPELWNYLESELGYVGRHNALTPSEIDAVNLLKLPIYLAPKD